MRYFKQEDFNKCMEFLKGKPDTVETQQGLYKFMSEECHMLFDWNPITAKDMNIYSRIYATRFTPKTANWCATMSNGSQVVWNRKYKAFYMINEVGTDHCSCINYLEMFPELKDIDPWLLENWSNWGFQVAQKQFIAIWYGKYNENFKNYWR